MRNDPEGDYQRNGTTPRLWTEESPYASATLLIRRDKEDIRSLGPGSRFLCNGVFQ